MNKTRFEKIAKLRESLDEILNEEQEYFDNLSENVQESDKGQQSQDAIDCLSEAVNALENIDFG